MEATKLFLSNPNLPRQPASPATSRYRQRSTVGAFSNGRSEHGGTAGSLVDENMIVLRVRIKEMKMLETCNNPPSHWMEWEKKYYEHHGYHSDVFEAVGLLQNFFMNIRPSLALGLVALVAMSVPISIGVVLFGVIKIAN